MRDQRLRQALGYRRFSGAPRLLVLDTSYYVLPDIVAGARALGWEVAVLPAASYGVGHDSFVAALLTALCQHRPDFLLTVNHRGFDEDGVLLGLLARYEVPVASWFVDHPLPVLGCLPAHRSENVQIFCVERTALPWLAAQGYGDPCHLPTAASAACHPTRIDPARTAALGVPLCLVGQSWWGIARQDPPEAVRSAAARLEAARPLSRAYVAERLAGELPELAPPLRARAAYVALAARSLEARRELAMALQPLGLRVYGDAHWTRLVPGLDLRPMIDSQTELPSCYAGSAVNVSGTAASLPSAANLRTWDVPGVGAFLLSDAQEDVLASFQEGEEVAVYRSPAEAAALARHYLRRPAARAAIAFRAFARVEQAHRYPHRLQVLYRTMRARFR